MDDTAFLAEDSAPPQPALVKGQGRFSGGWVRAVSTPMCWWSCSLALWKAGSWYSCWHPEGTEPEGEWEVRGWPGVQHAAGGCRSPGGLGGRPASGWRQTDGQAEGVQTAL